MLISSSRRLMTWLAESRPIVTHSHPLDTGVLQLTRKGVFPSLAKEGCRAEQQMRRYLKIRRGGVVRSTSE